MVPAQAHTIASDFTVSGAASVGLSEGAVVTAAHNRNLAVLSDEEVMLELQRGRDEGLDELYRRHFRGVYVFLVRMVRDRHLAEDLLQETFIRVFNNRKSWEPRSKFTSWLYRIARNLSIDEKRRYWNRLVQVDSQTQVSHEEGGSTTLLERFEADGDDAREAASQSVDEERIREAIATLSDEQREVMLLNKYHGMSYAEIAEVLELSPESVKQRAYRAHLKLRELLEPLLEEYV